MADVPSMPVGIVLMSDVLITPTGARVSLWVGQAVESAGRVSAEV